MEMKNPINDPNDSNEKADPHGRGEGNQEQTAEDGSTADERPLVSAATQGH
jgi:hypothetical protein